MLLTLTPNPSLDLLFTADRLVWDDANRVPMPRRRPGGQGINVVRAARALSPDRETLAIAPLGGAAGQELEGVLAAEGTPLRRVELEGGETRLFVGARERDTGRSLLLNPRGPDAGPALAEHLLEAVSTALEARSGHRDDAAPPWVACCGSLLPGLPPDFYGDVGRLARRHGARFVADCDGEALVAAVEVADMLVPNDMEAGRLVGRPVRDAADAVSAGRALIERGPSRVVVTLGDRGAVVVTRDEAWWAAPALPDQLAREAAEGSAVGAGDALLAALLLGECGERERLVEAVATGTAVLLARGEALVLPPDVDRVRPHVRVEEGPHG